MKKIIILLISIILFLSACKTSVPIQEISDYSIEWFSWSHIKYYGFALTDTYWDDPTDSQIKTDYSDELEWFTNLVDILIIWPDDSVIEKLDSIKTNNKTALLHLHELFFIYVDDKGPSWSNYDLRKNYKERWDNFVKNNNLSQYSNNLVFYIGEEPLWNGINSEEIALIAKLIKNQFPNTPNMYISAFPMVQEIDFIPQIDWIWFNHYFLRDPLSDSRYQEPWKHILDSKLEHQKTVIIMDSHYIPEVHWNFWDIEISDMWDIANRYFYLAQSTESTIALIWYFWPNGFDTSSSIWARWMPENIRDIYKNIWNEIIR